MVAREAAWLSREYWLDVVQPVSRSSSCGASMDRILVVEASESMRHMLRAVLEGAGFQVAEASDGATAIQLLKSGQFALILTDLMLAQKYAVSLLKTVREVDPFCRVIVMAPHGDIWSAMQAIKEGAHDFLTKPIDPDHLLRIIHGALEGRSRGSKSSDPQPTPST